MEHILIVDDDMHIGNMLEEVLVKEGYRVSRAYSGTEALLFLHTSRPDLILLDLMLPGLNGEEVLPQISDIPVIVVSAKADVTDKVELLLSGAVDYVTKPFEMKELLARIKVHLRHAPKSVDSAILKYADIILDSRTFKVSISSKESDRLIPVKLTRTEYAILKILMQNPNQVITKNQILVHISEETPDCTDSSLKTHISNLRKKLKVVHGMDYIEAVWGIGFKLKKD